MESSNSAPHGTEEAGDNNIIIKEDIIANNANDAVSDGDDSSVTSNDEELEEGYDSEEQDPAIEESIQNILDAAAVGDEVAVENHIEAALVLQQEANDDKHCWVCFGCEQDDPTASWVHPCRCRGTTKWVHQACIQRWVDEKQKVLH